MAPYVHGDKEGSESDLSQYTEEQLSKLLSPPLTSQEVRKSTGRAENSPVDNLQDKVVGDTSNGDDLYFEAAEHESVIFGVKLRNIHGVEILAADHECWTVNASTGSWGIFTPSKQPVTLTFGRVIALAGDFYSSHNDDNRTPICGAFFAEQLDLNTAKGWEAATIRFRSAVQSLKEDTDRNLLGLCGLIDRESHGVGEAEQRAAKRDPNDHIHSISNAYHNHECGIPTNREWWKATVGGKNPYLGLYTWLSYINADHFGDDALIAYKIGHTEAMRLAREAGMKSANSDRASGLQDAYMHEAFTLHYLSDMFSSGHLRTPRRQLHNDSYFEQSRAGAAIMTGGEVPIWDFQANYMHDNDSDTGLLVQNQLGQQWLCYGDKQFKESWDIVNRARIMSCIQASVDELFDDAFVGQSHKNPNDFKAVKLLPVPMLAAGAGPSTTWKSQWGGYDMHNTAPLWQVSSEADKSTWTLRANIEDHSVFDRRDGNVRSIGTQHLVYPKASQECRDVQGSSFRTKGSAPTAVPINGLTSGGFLQIQDLRPSENQVRTCVNFWGPVTVGIYDKKGNQSPHWTFTLRNRIVDFDTHEQLNTIQPLHSAKWHDEGGLLIYRLISYRTTGKDQITLSAWRVKEKIASAPGEPAKFDPDQSWAFDAESCFKKVPVTEVKSTSTHPNMIRLLIGNFMNRDSADVVTLRFDRSGPLQTTLVTKDGNLKSSSMVPDVEGVYNFAKKLKVGNSDHILLARFEVEKGESTNISLDTIDVSSQVPTSMKYQTSIKAPQTASRSVLVGDITGSGTDQAIILFDSPSELIVSLNELGPNGFHETLQKRISQGLASYPVIRPFFNALIPSEDYENSDRLSILQVSLYQINQSPHLIFRLTDTINWKTQTSEPVKDTLSSDPHYFHIKWIRCSRTSKIGYSTSNALLEVFSFYGVLGIRLFAPIDEDRLADYEEIGRLQYMAQTSIGTGLGAEGDWGNGILTWGVKEDDFYDIIHWTPAASGKAGEGTWGMSATDFQRPLVRGWEVTARPGYKN